MELSINCQKRPEGSKPKALRREGKIPATLYGHNGAESISLVVDEKAAGFLVRDAAINNTLIQVEIPDVRWRGKALLREVQTHPWKRSLYHLSFFSIAAQESVEVTVPLHFVGEATSVKNEGGTIDTNLNELTVKCAPDRIPERIDVDVSELSMGGSIQVSELSLPDGVESIGEPTRVVASVVGSISASAENVAEAAAAE